MKTVPIIGDPGASLCGSALRTAPRAWAFLRALLPQRRRRALLDVRSLPDHLKRDIGALDGNDPRGPRA